MSFEILHFRGAEKILKEKKMVKEIQLAMEYLDNVLYGTSFKGELLRQALNEMDWRPKEDLNILDGRRYAYKGFRNRVAMDGSFASYEYIQDALLRLQIGYDKKKIDMGIVILTAQRSAKSPLGSSRELVEKEIELLHPTISLPVTIVLFDLGKRGLYAEEGAQPVPEIKTGSDAINPEETDTHVIEDGEQDNGEDNHEKEPIHPEHVKHYLVHKRPGNGKNKGRKKSSASKSKVVVPPVQEEPSQVAVNQ